MPRSFALIGFLFFYLWAVGNIAWLVATRMLFEKSV